MRIEEIVTEALRQQSSLPNTHRGGNSSVTRVAVDSWLLGVKSYADRADGRQRCTKETAALDLLSRILPGLAPRCLGVSEDGLRSVLTWISGTHPNWDRQSCSDMLAIATRLHEKATNVDRRGAMTATDSLVGHRDISQQCHDRLLVLARMDPEWATQAAEPVLARLMSPKLHPSEIVVTLSPSDFGPHNLLVGPSRRVHCIDLEFFGWDDAHKLTIDTLCHPKNTWDERSRLAFLEGAIELYGLKIDRLAGLTPWILMKWGLIIQARAARLAVDEKESGARDARRRAARYLRWALSSVEEGVGSLMHVNASDSWGRGHDAD